MCIMEIHEHASKSSMIQAIAHNLSTIDSDLDMLREVAKGRKDHEMVNWVDSLQKKVHAAYADALGEFGMSLADVVMDENGHMPHTHGNEALSATLDRVTRESQKDETR
jgi:hypothetical protein